MQQKTSTCSYQELLRKKRREAFYAIARSIPDAKRRLFPYFDEETTAFRWQRLRHEEWTDDESRTLLWLKGLLSGRLSIPTPDNLTVFPIDSDMKAAIFCALAAFTYSSHVIRETYWSKFVPAPGTESIKTSA